MQTTKTPAERRREGVVVAVSAVLLVLVLWARLEGALLVGICAYLLLQHVVRFLSRWMAVRWAKPAALVVVIAAFAAVGGAIAVLAGDRWSFGGVSQLMDMLADTLDRLRSSLPAWLASRLPASLDQLQHMLAAWLRSNAQHLQKWGQDLLRGAAHAFIGIIVGVLAALEAPLGSQSPWLDVARRTGRNFVQAFEDILLAQIRIAAVNTILTAAFVLGALPAIGTHLPFADVLVALTFVVGLLPIVGNLVSNSAILLAALTSSLGAAIAALIFLLLIHKLEYLLNAHFVGQRTKVPASVLVASMVLLEALFGLAGLIAAPVYCAWAFREMRDADIY